VFQCLDLVRTFMVNSSEPSSISQLDRSALEGASPSEVRRAIREGRWRANTKRLALGRHQANVTIVPERDAFDFMRFCFRNPKALPLLDVTDPGDPVPRRVAPDADLRTDVGEYLVLREGKVVERVRSLDGIWRDDHVAFLTGCNLSLDRVMLEAGIPLPHLVDEQAFPAQFVSSIPCAPAGRFHGPLVVSLRPVADALVVPLVELTSRYALSHGGPVHIGDPARIGIHDLQAVDWGRPNAVGRDQTPMFWACGITAQAVAVASRVPEMIVHAPGRLFVTDLVVQESR
jgi:uncharacterized protein YcsI (UPF0317 family)